MRDKKNNGYLNAQCSTSDVNIKIQFINRYAQFVFYNINNIIETGHRSAGSMPGGGHDNTQQLKFGEQILSLLQLFNQLILDI